MHHENDAAVNKVMIRSDQERGERERERERDILENFLIKQFQLT